MNLQMLFIAMMSCFFYGSIIAPVSIYKSTAMDRAESGFPFSFVDMSDFPMQAGQTKSVGKIEKINAEEYWKYFYLQQTSFDPLAAENDL